MKVCKKCGIEKEIKKFYKHKQMPDGHLNICKECTKNRIKKNYYDNRKEKLEYAKKYTKENREKVKQYKKDYHSKNKERLRKEYKKYYEQNKEEKTKKAREYYNKNKDQCLEKHRKYMKTPRGKEVERNRRHRRREYLRSNNRKRNAVYSETDITIDWLTHLREEVEFCELCGVEMNNINPHPNQAQLDHIIPINIGGKHVIENVRFICAKCNRLRPLDGSDVEAKKMLKM
tara:strand:- start:271 stop:963 length:693 start_codon:yes stop_codon:yes gene_type:complete